MRIDHVNIVVKNMERSIAFYGGLIGMEQTFDVILEGEWIETVTGLTDLRARCVFFSFPGQDLRLELLQYFFPHKEEMPAHRLPNVPGIRHLAFEVEDLDALCARLLTAGVRFISPPVTVPFPVGNKGTKRLCYFYDPDGTLLEVAAYHANH
jgi:glyoxylase I family protein